MNNQNSQKITSEISADIDLTSYQPFKCITCYLASIVQGINPSVLDPIVKSLLSVRGILGYTEPMICSHGSKVLFALVGPEDFEIKSE